MIHLSTDNTNTYPDSKNAEKRDTHNRKEIMIRIAIEVEDRDFQDGDMTAARHDQFHQNGNDCERLGQMLGASLNSLRDHLRGPVEDIVVGMQTTLVKPMELGSENGRINAALAAVRPLFSCNGPTYGSPAWAAAWGKADSALKACEQA